MKRNFTQILSNLMLIFCLGFLLNPNQIIAQNLNDFSPTVSISLSNTDCDSLTDLTVILSQDAGEVDILTSLFTSDAGSFDISSMSSGDVIGSASSMAGAGFNTVNTTLVVVSTVGSTQAVIESVDIATGLALGTFTITNLNPGVSISATSIADGNNFTSGNSSTINFLNVFINPTAGSLTVTSTVDSELGNIDVQAFPFSIVCVVLDFSPTVSISLSNTDCDSLTDLTVILSQDAGEVDILTSLFTSDAGSFDISSMSSGDVIGSAISMAGAGFNTVNTTLVVVSTVGSTQAVIESVDIATGLALGTFTITNLNPGVSISATSIADGNNFTSGNSSTINFLNVFINPTAGSLTVTSTVDSELGNIDVQAFPFSIVCVVLDFSPTVSISLSNTDCDSLTDLTVILSQDAGEVDILTSLFTSDAGSFDISSMSSGDVIGSAISMAGAGFNTVNTTLVVVSTVGSTQAVIESVDIATGLASGTFTITNLNPGVSISATSIADGNNFTSGNSSTINFLNVFINPTAGSLTVTSTVDSELGNIDVQAFPFSIVCVVLDFSPTVSISLSNTDCDSLTDLTVILSQDAGEVDILTSLFTSDAGSFDISSMSSGDVIGSASSMAGAGFNTVNTTLVVVSTVGSTQAVIESVDIATGLALGTFTITNLNPGVSISATSIADGNNFTSGNSSTINFLNVFINPTAGSLTVTSTVDSELGNIDVQAFPFSIVCVVLDFSPTVSISLSNTDCDSLTDLTVILSQDAGEVDILTSLFTSDAGSFDISNMSSGDVIGSASSMAGAGFNTVNTTLVVVSTVGSTQAVIESVDIATGLALGTFTITNLNPGVSISATSIADGNNFTSGNSSTINFLNVFINPTAGSLTVTSTVDSELGNIDVQAFPFSIVCLCIPTTSSTAATECDDYTWNGQTYTASGVYTFTTTNSNGCDSVATLNLTINPSTLSSTDVTECDDYTWNGQTYTASGVYTFTTTNSNGCDSVATLNLTINPSTLSSTDVTECDDYTWNGQTYTASGVYTFTTTNSNGCDSVATLNLTINPSTLSSTDVTECDDYTWNGQTYTASGVYTFTTTNSNGCDSVATLNLTINPSTLSSTDVTECDDYTWNGQTYTASGVYTFTTTNSNGCDSVATLNLTINPSTLSSTDVTECDDYTWNGQTYTASGVYTFTTTNSNGCDSVATLNLTINPSTLSSTDVTECDDYTWNGQTYTASGVYTFTTTNSNGCDSVATLNLTINPSTLSSTDVTECDDYTWNGQTYTASGVYTFTTTNSNGCDSVATLNLTVNPSTTSTSAATSCDDYNWNGQTYTASGVYTFTTTNSNGCDSVATLNLTINPSTLSSTDVTECDDYTWNGQTYTASGVYTFTTTNSNGCDSVATLNLTVNPSTTSTSAATSCDDYNWNGQTYTASGVYTFTTTNSNGCDSVATLNLTINPSTLSSTDVTECDDYTWNGQTYTASGVYTFTTTNSNGCDSVATLNLTINPSTLSSTDVTECDDYTWNGQTYTASGVYTFTTTNSNGCDSVATLNLTINPSTLSSTDVTECDDYNWNGQTYIASGVYTFTTTNSNGCDSVATLNLTINPSTLSSTDVTECDDYTWNGQTYIASGVYTFTTTNSNGCDSVATLNLTVNPSTTSTSAATSCDDYNWNGQTYTASGVYTFTTTNSNGCDSVATLNLTINLPDGCTDPTQFNYDANAVCDDGSCIPFIYGCTDISAFNYNSSVNTDDGSCVPFTYGCNDPAASNYNPNVNTSDGSCIYLGCTDSAAVNYDPMATIDDGSCSYIIVLGCTDSNACNYDSTATVNDSSCFYPTVSSTDVTECDDYTWNGQTYTASGVYTFTTTNSNGCDSVATLNLTINPSTLSSTDVTECDDYTWNGQTYIASGVYTFTTTNSNGCDSVATLNLTVNPSTTSTSAATSCDDYNWNGQTYTASGVYTFTTTNSNGCDSVATLNLTINPSTLSSTDVTECDDYTWNGQTYIASGVYTFTTTNSNGCDSVATLNLTINPSTLSSTDVTECDDYNWNGQTYTASGVYTFTTTNSNGCDSTATLNLIINPSAFSVNNQTICFGYSYSINGNTYSSSGTYFDIYTTNLGCDSTVTTILTILPDFSVTVQNPTGGSPICLGESVTLSMTSWSPSGSIYQWNDLSGAISGATSSTYTTSVAGTYSLTVTNPAGCIATSSATTINVISLSPPTGLSVSNIQLDRATMNWSAVTDAHHYNIRMRVQGTSSWSIALNYLYGTSKEKLNLTSSTTYEWEIQSVCSSDNSSVSAWSSTESFTTTIPCTTPLNTTTTAIGLTDATLGWDVSPGALEYIVRYKQVNQGWGTFTYDTINTNSLVLSSLLSGTAYHWQVKSVCDGSGNNNSAFSSFEVFNTGSCNASLNIIQTNVGCFGGSDGSLDLSVIGGSGSFSYLWSDGSTSEDLTSLAAGTYSVTVTDNNTCQYTATYVITTPASAFSVTVQNPTGGSPICLGESVTLSMTSWSPSGSIYQWNDLSGAISGATSSTYTTSVAGTYSLTVTNPAGCIATSSATTINVISLSPPTGLSVSNIQLDRATMNWSAVTDADHYNIRMRVQGTSSWSIALNYLYGTSKEKLNLTSSTTYEWEIQSVCSSDNSSVSAWSSTESFTTTIPCTTPLNTTTTAIGLTDATLGWDVSPGALEYIVRYKQVNQGWGTFTYTTVTTNSLDLSSLLSGTAYHWQVKSVCDGSGNNNSAFSSFEVFNTGSCNASLNIIQTNVGCFGGSDGSLDLSVIGGSGSFSYLWSDGSTSEDLTSLAAGTYSVTVTDNNTCQYTATYVITTPASAFSVTTQNPTGGSPICLGESVTLSMTSWSPSGSIYQWNDLSGAISGATSSTYTTSVAGTYSLTVTNPAGCIATSSATTINVISLSPPTGLSVSNIQLDRATMNWSAVTDAHHYNIRMRVQGTSSWSIALNYLYGTSKEKFNLTSSTTYEWEIQSVCSSDNSSVSAWSSTESFTTTIPCTTPLNTTTTAIGLTDATLGWDVSPGALEYIVRYKQVNQGWGTFTSTIVTTNSLDLSSLLSGTAYHWQVKSVCDGSGNNNSAFSSFEVFNTGSCNASLNIIQTNVGCFGGSDGSLDLSVIGGSGSFSYLWSDGSTSEDLTSLAAGTYSVTVTDNNTCQYTATYVITTPASAFSVTTQNPTGGSPICLGESVTLSMTSWSPSGSIYQWNDLSGAISGATSSTYTTSVAGTYSLTVTNPAGCIATSSATTINVISLSPPTGLSVSNIQLDRATMNWSAVTDAHHYNIRMRVQGTSSWSIALNYLYGTSKEKLNLTSSTTYEWEIQSVCSSDNSSVSAWSSTESFTTTIPCTTPLNTTTTAIGLTDATLGWDVSPGALEYIVRYKQVNQGWGTFTYTTVTTNSLDLSSLLSGTAYHWQVKSVCDGSGNNNSAFSSFEVFNTGSCNASLNIIQTNVGCFGGSDGSLDLSVIGGSGSFSYLWSDGSTSEDLTSLAAGTYSVTVTDNNTCQYTATYVITTPASAFSVTVQNPTGGSPICLGESVTLSMTSWSPSGSIYQWNDLSGAISGATSSTYTTSVAGTYSLTVTNPAGCIATSSATTINVISLSPPTGLSVSNIQLDRATMNWSAVTDAHHYNIRMRVQGTSSWSIALNYLYGTSKEKLNLTSSTTYEWEIQSVCSSDNSSVSAWSSTQSFATLTVCTTPTNTNTTAIGLTDATLGWDVSPGALEYIVRYKQVNQGWGTFTYTTVTTNSLDLSSLLSGTAYHWQVKSVCDGSGNNNSAFSSFEVFNTVNGCIPPTNIIIDSITTSSAVLSWDSNPAAFTYRLMYLVVGAPWNTRIDTTITPGLNNLTLTGLISNENYRFRIRTICDPSVNYNSAWTGWDTVTTLAGNRITAGDIDLGEYLNIYPNPTRGLFNISFMAEKLDNFEITIVDAFGKLVFQEDKQDFIGEYTKRIDFSNSPRGIFMIQIRTRNSFVSKRIVLQ